MPWQGGYMFETSQQESGSGSSKIVGGSIAGVGVLMVGFYLLFMQGNEPATTPGEGQAGMTASSAPVDEGPADPMRDLAIQRFSLDRDRTQTMAMWTIQIANRSRQHGYKDVLYATKYYNSDDVLIYENTGTIAEQLNTGDQRTISEINDGLFPVGTVRYTIELTDATSVTEME